MLDPLKICVDGEKGAVIARDPGIRVVEPEEHLALVRLTTNKDGAHGRNAAPAIPGAPAGSLAVEITPSNVIGEGIHVEVLRYASRQQPPELVEVPARRDFLLSAVGGDGEDGGIGGDGQNGLRGDNGSPATRDDDATPGMNGGNGGDAGQGTSGADGGEGGAIEIHLHEDNTHLLMAAVWNIDGGHGGAPGHHGNAGQGGPGGSGGKGHKWEEEVGHRYICTSQCVGRGNTGVTNTSITRATSQVGNRALALAAPMMAQNVIPGGNLQTMIGQVAARYGAMRHQRQNPGACKCAGGGPDMACRGCDAVPIHSTFKRAAALDGREGRSGRTLTTPISSGLRGAPGTATIIVRMRNGERQEYSSKYKLELVDFDIEDENGDGIFEPGEHIYIRRIRVRNSGGMPSPLCNIPLTVNRSPWLQPVDGIEGQAMIPSSIATGVTATLSESIKVRVRPIDHTPPFGTKYFEHDEISITAKMPWLNRDLPNFEYKKTLDIQYPIELRQYRFLPSLAQGSITQFTFEVYNRSERGIGIESSSLRNVQAVCSFPRDAGALQTTTDEWDTKTETAISNVPAGNASMIPQSVRILDRAETYRHVSIELALYIDEAGSEDTEEHAQGSMIMIEQLALRVQICSHYVHNPQSSFLLVTNSETTRHQVHRIQSFIGDALRMQMDEWNMSLYGQLSFHAEPAEEGSVSVFEVYRGKSIVFLGNRFEFFTNGSRTIAELCGVSTLTEACMVNTSCLFLGLPINSTLTSLMSAQALPVPCPMVDVHRNVPKSRQFENKRQMLDSVKQSRLAGSPTLQTYLIATKGKWYRLGKASSSSESRRLARFIQQQLPQERFMVVPSKVSAATEPDDIDRDVRKKVAILHGCSHDSSVIATEQQPVIRSNAETYGEANGNGSVAISKLPNLPASNQINRFEGFMLVHSLPESRRIDLIWPIPHTDGSARPNQCSDWAREAAFLSVLWSINTHIRIFLDGAKWPNVITFPKTVDCGPFLRLHLSILSKILYHPNSSSQTTPPETVIEILEYAHASCSPQRKRHIASSILMPIRQRRLLLKKLLGIAISDFLARTGHSKADTASFYKAANSRHSSMESARRDTSKVILSRLSQFTGLSDHAFEHGHLTASKALPRSVSCTVEEWDTRWREIDSRRVKIEGETEAAQEALGRMNLDGSDGG